MFKKITLYLVRRKTPYLLLSLRRKNKIGGVTMTKERKLEIINEYKRDEADTGSAEVQVALLT